MYKTFLQELHYLKPICQANYLNLSPKYIQDFLRIALSETYLISQIVFIYILSLLSKTYLPTVQDDPSRAALSETYLPSKLSKIYLPNIQEVFLRIALSETYLISQVVFIYILSKREVLQEGTALSDTYLSTLS